MAPGTARTIAVSLVDDFIGTPEDLLDVAAAMAYPAAGSPPKVIETGRIP